MDAARIARRRWTNLRLARPAQMDPPEAVAHLVAVQAQDYVPAKWSVGQRITGSVHRDLDDALRDGTIVRTHVLRPTWHLVAREDLRWLLRLTGPRVQRHNGPRLRELGLDSRTLQRCERILETALRAENGLTRDDLASVLDAEGVDRSGQRLPYILMHCELEAVICSGPRVGKHHSYALVDERVPPDGGFDRDRAVVELIGRYLKSHGPATVHDLRWWSSLTVADVKQGLRALGTGVRRVEIDGEELWWVEGNRDLEPRGARLLPSYDEFIVGYTRSRFFGDPLASTVVAAWKDRSVPNGVVAVDGELAGHWRWRLSGDRVEMETRVYEPSLDREEALRREAGRLGRFLEREAVLKVVPC